MIEMSSTRVAQAAREMNSLYNKRPQVAAKVFSTDTDSVFQSSKTSLCMNEIRAVWSSTLPATDLCFPDLQSKATSSLSFVSVLLRADLKLERTL